MRVLGAEWYDVTSWSPTAWGVIIALALGVVNLARPIIGWVRHRRHADLALRFERYVWRGEDQYRVIVTNGGGTFAKKVLVKADPRTDPMNPRTVDAGPSLEPDEKAALKANFRNIGPKAEVHINAGNLAHEAGEVPISALWAVRWTDRRRKPQTARAEALRRDVTA